MVRLVGSRGRQRLVYRKVVLSVCGAHTNPFASDEWGYITERHLVREEGRQIAIVSLASEWEALHTERGRPAYGPRP